jgi:hypothetical protein
VSYWKIDKRALARKVVRDAARKGLIEGAEHILEESNRLVPHQTGTLERSGETRIIGDSLTAYISYGGAAAAYAVYQHERTDLSHPNGRQAKFLETAVKERGPAAIEHVRSAIKAVL